MKTDKGFTLLEIMIYIALFSLLMGSAFITAYQIIDGTSKLGTKTIIQEEGNFVMRKLNWVLTSLDYSSTPTVGGSLPCSQTLSVQKVNFTPNPVSLRLNGTTLEISKNGGTYLPLTTPNVSVTCLKFSIIPSVGSKPSGIRATTTINGIDFAITKYFRK